MCNNTLVRFRNSVAGLMGVAVLIVVLSAGCGGAGDCTNCTGSATGYVYQPEGGGTAIISASSEPPAGYEPVPVGTIVRVDGYPELQTTTNEDGAYRIDDIMVGTRHIIVEAPTGEVELNVPIISNRTTSGGGHEEGGGGVG